MIRKTMLAVACGVAILVSTVALKVSLSNEGRLSDLAPPAADDLQSSSTDEDDPFGPAQDRAAQAGPQFRKPNASAPRQSDSLRQRFVELNAKRAQRMSDEELGQAVEEITKTLADQDSEAEAALDQAVEQLNSVVEKFPGTPSAERANRALEAIKTQPVRKSDQDLDDREELSSAATKSPAQPIRPKQKPPKR